MIVEAIGTVGNELDRHFNRQPVAHGVPTYSEEELRNLLRGFGLTEKTVEDGIREGDERGDVTFAW